MTAECSLQPTGDARRAICNALLAAQAQSGCSATNEPPFTSANELYQSSSEVHRHHHPPRQDDPSTRTRECQWRRAPVLPGAAAATPGEADPPQSGAAPRALQVVL